MSAGPALLWLRDDLRTDDHDALRASCAEAAAAGVGVVACWIREDVAELGDGGRLGPRPLGGAARWWAHRSLEALADQLGALGIPLVHARGDAREIIPRIAQGLETSHVRWSRRYAPRSRALDAEVKSALAASGVEAHSHPGALLAEPWEVRTGQGEHYRVFTPFHRAASRRPIEAPVPAPAPVERAAAKRSAAAAERLRAAGVVVELDALELLDVRPTWWRETVAEHWTPGEPAAHDALAEAMERIDGYREGRDLPGARAGTSRLSPRLRFGELSPRQALAAAHAARVAGAVNAADADAWTRQIFWREFSWHLAYAIPDLEREPIRPEFRAFPFEPDQAALEAWRRGRTGFALIDAGMRELWETGWMHNRVRMAAASLLAKNLLQPWWDGEAWFWDTLVDADEANNPVSWQWVAGCGADAAPYFRVFNPELQREKFDADGSYVARWAPESDLGPPIVELSRSRLRALAAYDAVKGR